MHRRAEAGPKGAGRARQLLAADTQAANRGGEAVSKCVRQSGWGTDVFEVEARWWRRVQ